MISDKEVKDFFSKRSKNVGLYEECVDLLKQFDTSRKFGFEGSDKGLSAYEFLSRRFNMIRQVQVETCPHHSIILIIIHFISFLTCSGVSYFVCYAKMREKRQKNIFLYLGVFNTCATAVFVYFFIVGLPLSSLPITLLGVYLILDKFAFFIMYFWSLFLCKTVSKQYQNIENYLETYNPNKNKKEIISFDDLNKNLNSNSNHNKES